MAGAYNSFGRRYKVPRERVSSIYELNPGDHIAFHRFGGTYWHHAIVEDVDYENEEVDVIHFYSDISIPSIAMLDSKLRRDTYSFPKQTIYRMNYRRSFHPDVVVDRAISMMKSGEEKYNVVTNNCEHFAMKCKTGEKYCDQAETVAQLYQETATRTAVKTVQEFGGAAIRNTGSQFGKQVFVKSAPGLGRAAFHAAASREMGRQVSRAGARVVTRQAGAQMLIRSAGDEIGKQAATGATSAASGAAGALVGGLAVGGVIEGVSIIYDIASAHDDYEEGRITGRQFDDMVAKRVVTGTSSVTAAATGAVVGQAIIPIPFVGAAIGGFFGGLGGLFFGNLLVN